jgi:Methyltransferase domain
MDEIIHYNKERWEELATTFDIVYHAHSINFIPEVETVFSEVARVLKPGGLHRSSCHNPVAHGIDEREWAGAARLHHPGIVGGIRRRRERGARFLGTLPGHRAALSVVLDAIAGVNTNARLPHIPQVGDTQITRGHMTSTGALCMICFKMYGVDNMEMRKSEDTVIPVNAEVRCTDGTCGHSTCVLINPITNKVTHLVVKEAVSPHGIYRANL